MCRKVYDVDINILTDNTPASKFNDMVCGCTWMAPGLASRWRVQSIVTCAISNTSIDMPSHSVPTFTRLEISPLLPSCADVVLHCSGDW